MQFHKKCGRRLRHAIKHCCGGPGFDDFSLALEAECFSISRDREGSVRLLCTACLSLSSDREE